MTWATDRLDQIVAGTAEPPPVVTTLKLGLLDAWGEGWVRKTWAPSPGLALAFAAMTVVGEAQAYRTINLALNFVRVTRMVPLTIEARVVAVTKQVITARAEFRREDGALVAEATAQQFLMPFPGT